MDRYGFFAAIFTISIIVRTSNASVVFSSRKLNGAESTNSSTASQGSPVPSPVSAGGNAVMKPNPISAGSSGKEKPKDAKVDNNTDKGVPKDGKMDNSAKSPLKNEGSCEGVTNFCRDQKDMLACIVIPQNGSKEYFMVVQNKGKHSLSVNTNLGDTLPTLEIPKQQSRRIDITSAAQKSTKVILNAGSGECMLPLYRPVSVGNFVQQLSFYSKKVTPLHGAYFSILIVFLVGGTWACCMFSKRRQQDEVPYQELEMGLPESTPANMVTAEDWDQDWDDDWDDDGPAKSTNGHHSGSISANGLTSRSTRKEGWEEYWED